MAMPNEVSSALELIKLHLFGELSPIGSSSESIISEAKPDVSFTSKIDSECLGTSDSFDFSPNMTLLPVNGSDIFEFEAKAQTIDLTTPGNRGSRSESNATAFEFGVKPEVHTKPSSEKRKPSLKISLPKETEWTQFAEPNSRPDQALAKATPVAFRINSGVSGKKKNTKIENASAEGKLVWTPIMDEALMDAFLHQHNLGNRVNGSFTTKAYENIVNELKDKLGKDVDKDKVKNRLKTLKGNLSKSHDLFKNLSGFSWNPITKLWSAEPEVWDALIKVNKDAQKWMTKLVLHYDTFVILFGNDRATGDKSETAKELKRNQPSLHDNESHDTIEDIDRMVSQNQVFLDGFETNDVDFDPLTCLGGFSNVSTSSKSKKIKKSREIENEAKGIQEAINNVTRVRSEGNSHPPLSEAEVWNMLEDLGVNSDKITSAYLYLLEHPDKLRAVLGCPTKRRLDIVMRVVFGTC